MSRSSPGASRSVAEFLLRAVLSLYPRDFKERHRNDVIAVFRDLRGDTLERSGRLAAEAACARAVIRALVGAGGEWVQEMGSRTGESRRHRASPTNGKRGRGSMIHDVRYAIRSLRKSPGFALTVILLLATGIGATTTVFSVVDGVVIRSLPYPDPDRIIYLANPSHSPADFRIWQEEITSVATWGGVFNQDKDLVGEGPPEQVDVGSVTPDFFGIFHVRAAMGRLFLPSDFSDDVDVAVVSHHLWQRRWGGDPGLLGRDIRLGGATARVIGILGPGATPPESLTRGPVDVWTPYDPVELGHDDHTWHTLYVVGRLGDGRSVEAARQEMAEMDVALSERFPDSHVNRDGSVVTAPVEALQEAVVGDIRGPLFLFLGAVGLLLLIACANVANLLLARGTTRAREMAIRGALGAGRRNLLAQIGAESLVLALAGGALGAGFAFAGVRAFKALEPGIVPRLAEVSVDGRVLAFTLTLSAATGLIFGILPAMVAMGTDAAHALRENATRSTAPAAKGRTQSLLVVAEVALSTVLLAGAGILFSSFVTLRSTGIGFQAEQLVTVNLFLEGAEWGATQSDGRLYDQESRELFLDQLLERIRGSVPGARAVVAGSTLPFQYASGGSCCWRTAVEPVGEARQDDVISHMKPVTPGFVTALGIQLLAGRDLAPDDHRTEPVPAVVNESFARELFGGSDAIGREVTASDFRFTIVGIAGDIRSDSFESEPRPTLYLPWKTRGSRMPFLNVGIRTDASLKVVAPVVREVIWAIDPNLPVPEIVSMETRLARSVADERFMSALLGAFAAVALLLAAGGVYATLLYAVRQREREMGIRMALGARGRDVIRLVLGKGLKLTLGGLVLGLLGALAGARVLESMVFGISPRDPATLAGVAAVLAAVATVACLLPALRAGRTDPMDTLRVE